MATGGGDGNENMFQLLPSDYRGIEAADRYARERRTELSGLKLKVEKMGWFRTFWDSKVPQEDRGILNISFSHTDPAEIEAEIEKCLAVYQMMITAAKKIDNERKSEAERHHPYLVIIKLNKELTDLFELAQSGKQKTNSKTVSKLYDEFLSKQSELENEIKKLECAFLKQHLSAESERIERNRADAARAAEEGRTHQEERLAGVSQEVNDLRNDNEALRQNIERITQRLEALFH